MKKAMIFTTTPNIEGRAIDEYLDVVSGEVVASVALTKNVADSLRNFFGGRSLQYEDELIRARSQAIGELTDRADILGADAVVGIDFDYHVVGSPNCLLIVTVSGTAVKLA